MSLEVGKVMTIVLTVHDVELAKDIFLAYMQKTQLMGCTVDGMAEGDLIDLNDQLADEILALQEVPFDLEDNIDPLPTKDTEG